MASITLNRFNLEEGLFQLDAPESVTQLTCSNDPNICKVPAGIERLTHLQYLNLSNTGIDLIPASVAGLKELRVLDLRGTSISFLPKALLESTHDITILLLGCKKAVSSNFTHHSRHVTLVFPQ